MKFEDANADVAAATAEAPKAVRRSRKQTRSKRNTVEAARDNRKPVKRKSKPKIGSRLQKMAHNLMAYVRSGFKASYDKGFELGVKLRRYATGKVNKLLNKFNYSIHEFCDDAQKIGIGMVRSAGR